MTISLISKYLKAIQNFKLERGHLLDRFSVQSFPSSKSRTGRDGFKLSWQSGNSRIIERVKRAFVKRGCILALPCKILVDKEAVLLRRISGGAYQSVCISLYLSSQHKLGWTFLIVNAVPSKHAKFIAMVISKIFTWRGKQLERPRGKTRTIGKPAE